MKLQQFKECLSHNICPFCDQKMKYYDGALGYEAMRCYGCNFIVDHNGMHLEKGWTDNNGKHKMNCEDCGAETEYDHEGLCHKCLQERKDKSIQRRMELNYPKGFPYR